jgi:hypothetical protein
MKLFARYLLWILIAVLPMQGNGAAGMAMGARKIPAVAQGGHCGQDAVHAAAADGPAMAGDGLGDEAGKAHAKCRSCASCCVGASAPPLELAQPFPHLQVNDAAVLPEPAMTAYIASAPERPPRAHA